MPCKRSPAAPSGIYPRPCSYHLTTLYREGYRVLLTLLQFFCHKIFVFWRSIWKSVHFTAASRRIWRTSSPPFTASRWRTFWTTTPCFCTGATETFSADTGRQRAGTVSSFPTTQRSAEQASAAGKADKRPSVRSAFPIWWKTLVPIFHPCFACEVW